MGDTHDLHSIASPTTPKWQRVAISRAAPTPAGDWRHIVRLGFANVIDAFHVTEFTDIGTSRVAVDHVLPVVLMSRGWQDGDLHQVWNLVLACYACNSAKRDCPPAADWMPWLEQRGESLIASHHPLRETLISLRCSARPVDLPASRPVGLDHR